MDPIILTLLLYFTPYQIAHGTPEKVTMKFDTYAECEYYVEKYTPEIQKEMDNSGLLGYSIRCDVQ